MNWNKVEDLTNGFISDILHVSGGLLRYQIIEHLDVDDFPVKVDGYKYDAQTYLNVLRGVIAALSLAIFVGIVLWAWSGRQRERFDEASRLPFVERDEL